MSKKSTKFKSFNDHPCAKHFSKKNKISPKDISISTHKKYIFECPTCEHEFVTSPMMKKLLVGQKKIKNHLPKYLFRHIKNIYSFVRIVSMNLKHRLIILAMELFVHFVVDNVCVMI